MGVERLFIVSKSGGLIYSYDNQAQVTFKKCASGQSKDLVEAENGFYSFIFSEYCNAAY